METQIISIIGYREGPHFIAYCLDFNLASQGNSVEEALSNLKETVSFYVKTEFSEGKTFDQMRRRPPLSIKLKFYGIVICCLANALFRHFNDKCQIVTAKLRGCELDLLQYLPS